MKPTTNDFTVCKRCARERCNCTQTVLDDPEHDQKCKPKDEVIFTWYTARINK